MPKPVKSTQEQTPYFLSVAQRVYRFLIANKYLIGIVGSVFLLILSAGYSVLQASASQLSVGDQYNLTYMVKDWHLGDTLNMLSQRTNLLKLPLLWLQGQLPYGIVSHNVINLALVITSLVGWSFMSYRLLKRKAAFIASNLIFSGLMLSSVNFAISVTMPAIRNIEYLLVFEFILLLARLLQEINWFKWTLAFLIIGLLVASDYLYLYTLSVAAVVGILYNYYLNKLPKRRTILLIGCIGGGSLSGLVLIQLLNLTGVFNLIGVPRTFISYTDFWPQTQNSLQHILVLFGGDFFGKPTTASSIAYIIGAAFAGLAIFSIFKMRYKGYVYITTSIFALLVLLAYLLSSQAVSSFANIRYISVIPFVGTLAVLANIRKNSILLYISCVVFIAGIAMIPTNRADYRSRKQLSNNFVSLDNKVIEYMTSNHIHVGLGTYAYSAPTWFYTHKKVDVFTIKPCNGRDLPLSNSRWYKPSENNLYTALIIDRAYSASDTWETWAGCSNQVLERIYGNPALKKVVGVRDGSDVEVWIYHYDIRSKLITF